MEEYIKNLLSLKEIKENSGIINTKKINSIFRENNLNFLEGESPLEKAYLLHNKRTYCEICGSKTPFISWNNGYKRFCSPECKSKYQSNKIKEFRNSQSLEDKRKALEKSKQTCLEKFGVPFASQNKEIQNKIKETVKEKYNCENISQLESVKKKKVQTCLEHFNVSNPFKSKEIRKKALQTNLERYGFDNPFRDPNFHKNLKEKNLELYGRERIASLEDSLRKSRETNLRKRGVEYNSQSQENKDKVSKTWKEKIHVIEKELNCTSLNALLEKYGSGWYQNESFSVETLREKGLMFIRNVDIPLIEKYVSENVGNKSHGELEVLEYCRSLLPSVKIISNTKQIIKSKKGNPIELDIYIPSKKLAI